jgi:ribulose 1,5-bisphosphate synthetase/thiazole synthase
VQDIGSERTNSQQTGSESQPVKTTVRTLAFRIVPVLGGECRLDPKIVLSSEVSDSTEKSAHVIRICGERHRPPHNLSQLCGTAKLWSASVLRVLSGLGRSMG